MIWVTAEDVVAIHSRIIQVSGGIDGLRDRAGLEAAIAAPLQSFGGEDLFPTDIEKIARIGFGLASNHAFIDGNKRIGEYSARDCAPQPLKLSIHSGGIEHPCRCR
jgi:death-on-curing protein